MKNFFFISHLLELLPRPRQYLKARPFTSLLTQQTLYRRRQDSFQKSALSAPTGEAFKRDYFRMSYTRVPKRQSTTPGSKVPFLID